MKNIGIFGGSFNPIHVGHIALAKAMLEHCGMDEVWLMVSPQNPLKLQSELLDDQLRLEIAQQAVKDVKGVVASDYEFHLPKPSYTWHTLQSLSKDHPNYTFTLLIGGDNWERFERWYHWKDILRNYDVVVYPRCGVQGVSCEMRGTRVQFLNAELLDVSSTEIRLCIREGKSIKGMVPEAVEELIKKQYS